MALTPATCKGGGGTEFAAEEMVEVYGPEAEDMIGVNTKFVCPDCCDPCVDCGNITWGGDCDPCAADDDV